MLVHMLGMTTICLTLPLRLNTVNCFLLNADGRWLLIDTGCSINRAELDARLEQAGCVPGSLELIVLTHGDFDHAGNARHLREKYGSRIAMHRDDLGMVEQGDLFCNRGKGNPLVRAAVPILFGFGKGERFSPDLLVDEGFDLSPHGFHLEIVSLPAHSRGSIGILTRDGDLFCGDLFVNEEGPALNTRFMDPALTRASVEKLAAMEIAAVFPSHGGPFSLKNLVERPG
jgi:hydroxyacylglutathione hydrolase